MRLDQYDWSKRPEDDEAVIRLYQEGKPLAAIARHMQTWRRCKFSRQMIDGRLKRLTAAGRLTRHGSVHPNFIDCKPKPPRPKQAKPVPVAATPAGDFALLDPVQSTTGAAVCESRAFDRETAPLEHATFRPRFKPEPCCFPMGKDGRRWITCDEPSVPGRSPYCAEHKKASWVTWADIKAKQEATQEQRA